MLLKTSKKVIWIKNTMLFDLQKEKKNEFVDKIIKKKSPFRKTIKNKKKIYRIASEEREKVNNRFIIKESRISPWNLANQSLEIDDFSENF